MCCYRNLVTNLMQLDLLVFVLNLFSSVQSLVVSICLQCHGLQDAKFPIHHQHPEISQAHVHRVGDAIQPSHPLSSPSPPAFNLSLHQGLFQ